MPRDARANLADAIDACDAIIAAVDGLDLGHIKTHALSAPR